MIDIADMENPVPTGACSIGGYARQVIVSGDLLYVLGNDTGLTIFDISGLDGT